MITWEALDKLKEFDLCPGDISIVDYILQIK